MAALDKLKTMDKADLKRLAKQEKLLFMAADQWPGIMSITDYTDQEPRLVYMNEKLLEYEGVSAKDYYKKTKSEVLKEGDMFTSEDFWILKSEKPQPFLNTDRYGSHWIKYKWRIVDGDRRYVVAQLIEVTDAMIEVFIATMDKIKTND